MNKVKLSVAALLAGISIVSAEDIPVVNVGGAKISMYGFVQLNAVYEDTYNKGVTYSDLAPSGNEDGEGRFLMNIDQTRLGFNFAGPNPSESTEVSAKFEADFSNNSNNVKNGTGDKLRIRHAFGQIKFKDLGLSLLIGQSGDLLTPISAPTLSQSALKSAGSIGTRRPQIRLTQAIGPVELAVAATHDQLGGNAVYGCGGEDAPETKCEASPSMPGFQASLKGKIPATWAGEKQNVEVTLSGQFASLDVAANSKAGKDFKDDLEDEDKMPGSWAGAVSLSAPIVSTVSLQGEFFMGQNLSDFSGGSLGIKGKNSGKNPEEGIQSMGGWGALNIKLPLNFSLTGGAGVEGIDKDHRKDGSPSSNLAAFGNVKYGIGPAFIGVEYTRIQTDYEGKDSGALNRVELAFQYALK